MSGDIALYIHIPFCRRKCRYCSFISYAGREADMPAYIEALKTELKLRSRGEHVSTVYFGGGTPSLLSPENIHSILAEIHELYSIAENAEITMEANPGTIDEAYLKAIKSYGVNRLSLGIQSLNDDELLMLGRIHTSKEAKEAVCCARKAGFNNLNLDLIYGLPGQSLAKWKYSLEEALNLKPEHLSLYALTLEPDTPMQTIIDRGELTEIDPDLAADRYELSEEILEQHGYIHYEISNWAKPGKECRHNLFYWQNMPYIGIGAAAHSCINGHRLANTGSLDKYLADYANSPSWSPEMDESISPELELAESIILGLRLGKGINKADIKERFGIDVTERFKRQIREMDGAGLLEQSNGNIRLTARGRLLSNQVFYRLLPEK